MIIFQLELFVMDTTQEVYNYTSLELINKESRFMIDNDFLNKIDLPTTSSKLVTIKTKENRLFYKKRKYYQLDKVNEPEDDLLSAPCKKFKYLSINEKPNYMQIDS
jgi:hypothetical protein